MWEVLFFIFCLGVVALMILTMFWVVTVKLHDWAEKKTEKRENESRQGRRGGY